MRNLRVYINLAEGNEHARVFDCVAEDEAAAIAAAGITADEVVDQVVELTDPPS